jgi:MSHA biogenesis protein MshJ
MIRALLAKFALIAILSKREQFLVFFAVLAVIVIGTDQLLITPQSAKILRLETSLAKEQKDLAALKASLASSQQVNAQEISELTGQRDELLTKVAEASRVLDEAGRSNNLPRLMRRMVTPGGDIKLLSIRSIPSTPYTSEKPLASNSAAPLYQHGIEVSLRGKYVDLVKFLRTLGSSQPSLFWSNLQLQVGTHPDTTLKLVVSVLSTSKEIQFE